MKDIYTDISASIIKLLLDDLIAIDVMASTIKLIKDIPFGVLNKFDKIEVLNSNYKTALIDFHKSENSIYLEVGENTFGYFSWEDGRVYTIREMLTVRDYEANEIMLYDFKFFLSNF